MCSIMIKYTQTAHKYEASAKILLPLLVHLQGTMTFNFFARYRLENECKSKLDGMMCVPFTAIWSDVSILKRKTHMRRCNLHGAFG